jgi:hypothetical protein
MEREERSAWVVRVTRVLPATCGPRFTFNCRAIALTEPWAVLHNQPVGWACRPRRWPAESRAPRLPTSATLGAGLAARPPLGDRQVGPVQLPPPESKTRELLQKLQQPSAGHPAPALQKRPHKAPA